VGEGQRERTGPGAHLDDELAGENLSPRQQLRDDAWVDEEVLAVGAPPLVPRGAALTPGHGSGPP
jgi:hypothetical protein